MVHEVSPIPHPGRKEEGREVQEKAVPVPYEFEGIENVVENGERSE